MDSIVAFFNNLTIIEVFLGIALVGGFYMAWNIGANDVANAFGTSVGSGALTIRRAILLAAVCEFAGAFFVGSPVAATISSKIIDVPRFLEHMPDKTLLGVGMLAALLGAAIWLNVATFFGQPVSTTHAIIGAVIGFGIVAGGPQFILWGKMGAIAASWIVSPVIGGVMAFIIYRWGIRKFILDNRHPVFRTLVAAPIAMGLLGATVTFSVLFKGPPKLQLDYSLGQALPISLGVGLLICLVVLIPLRSKMTRHGVRWAERYRAVERWFGFMQIPTACYMSFAHGANDVANAVGPLAAAVQIFRDPSRVAEKIQIDPWLLAFGGLAIVIGLATYGYKVIEALGRKITEITPTRGFSAEFATATTVIVFSKWGMPISTTFVIVGAVMGVGFARGFGAIDLRVIRRIFASWVITIPASAIFGAVVYWILLAIYT